MLLNPLGVIHLPAALGVARVRPALPVPLPTSRTAGFGPGSGSSWYHGDVASHSQDSLLPLPLCSPWDTGMHM